jgi:hypothetical protein
MLEPRRAGAALVRGNAIDRFVEPDMRLFPGERPFKVFPNPARHIVHVSVPSLSVSQRV